MDSFVDRTTKEQNKRFADKCIEFFAKCNIPFAICEDESFRALIHELRPNMKIPTRKEMAGELLESCYEREIEKTRELVQGQRYGTILGDEWKNMSSNRKKVVTSMAAGPQFVMIKSFDATKVSETGEYLLKVVKETQQIAKDLYGVTCNAVVTDNAPNMILMGKLLAGEGDLNERDDEFEEPENEDDEDLELNNLEDEFVFPGMFHSRCHAHIANLVLKDIGKHLKLTALVDKIKPVFKEFKKPEFAAKLVDEKGTAVFAPFEVRWCTYRDSLKSFTKNVHLFRKIAQSDEEPNGKVALIIYNDPLINECKDAIFTLDPVCKVLNNAQKNACKVSDEIENWLVLKEESVDWLKNVIDKRLQKHKVFANEAIIANILDPKYRGKKLPDLLKQRGDDAILSKLDMEGQRSYLQYSQKVGRFATIKDELHLEMYWKLAKSGHRALEDLAQSITHVPASSAALERLFSNWGYVHNKVRNRLGTERSEKLAYIYYSHRVTRSQKHLV